MHRLACLEGPVHRETSWRSAGDMFGALIRWSDPQGRYRAHPAMIRRLAWWQDDPSDSQIEEWLHELEAQQKIAISPAGRSSVSGDEVAVLQILQRQRYRRFKDRADIPDATRHAVYKRDGFRCVACGSGEDLSLDHVWPYSLGGEDAMDNLQTMCRPCNCRKGATV